ncbi:sulfatase-like hydrolase/transferase [Pontiella sulfatireligans]|uniref:Choline-sulfatase n=1 Tax=Pontiella sulfatireligans TaxID=2750658 RepID=A0A6C2UGH2_9BACT|nr:sulfatase-like hydrolase/transferase [Pontiella sulfatireligans]SPS74314.1 sulfatase S1_16 [Kiritimatiellales bacterium]VGO19312.1 Choline-sulfatase [Pontiella sulfatireligans]
MSAPYLLKQTVLVVLMSVVGTATVHSAQTSGTKKTLPNIVLILADDQGWNALSVPADPDIPDSGSRYFHTPNLEQLAMEGSRFSWAYSGGPTCSPSRHSIQFGRTPASLGIVGYSSKAKTVKADNRNSLANVLKRARPDYITAHFGKWHMIPSPEDLGFDVNDGPNGNKEGDSKNPDDPKLIYTLTRKVEGFIADQVKAGKPFFLQVSHYANHLTYQALPQTAGKYENERAGLKTKYHHDALWAAMNENLDDSVGTILAKLKELGIEDNTYVIYTADNGYENKASAKLPAHERGYYKAFPQRAHKYTLNEGGIRVPMIIRGPGIEPNTVCRTPVAGLDLLPTILDFTGVGDQVPESVEGGSLLPMLKGRTQVKRNIPGFVFRYSKLWQRDVAIVQGQYKLLMNADTRMMYLWDLSNDIGEERNLIKEYPEVAERMRRTMVDYFHGVDCDAMDAKNKSKKKK